MIKRILLALVILGCCLLVNPLSAQAKNLFGSKVCTGDASKSAACVDNAHTSATQDPLSGKNGLLVKITNIIAFVGGAAAVIMILVSAIRFVTSGSDISTSSRTDTDVENARKTIAGALIGLAVIVLARSLILFFLQKL